MQLNEKVCLIIPCFNEATRLNMNNFIKADPHIFYIFVDDGSTDQTSEIIRPHLSGRIHLLRLEKNQGKAEAVRRGMMHFIDQEFFSGIRWAGFWDADLATPLVEVGKFLRYENFYSNVAAIWGSRVFRLGGKITRTKKRHFFGRLFATAIAYLFQVESYDTQCGAKLFKREVIHQAFGQPFISRWIFDVEILLSLKNHRVIEYPVAEWHDIAGSKLKVSRQMVRVAIDLYNIHKKFFRSKSATTPYNQLHQN